MDSRDESARLDVLRQYGILDTPPEQPFDDLAALAARLCDTPMALITFVSSDRQWFKARIGISVDGTPREFSFCAHAILQSDVFVVPDATVDERFAANPLVTGPPNARFYAGAPLATLDGHALGTICVIDRVPRELSDAQRDGLRALARQVVNQLDFRRTKTHDVAHRRAEELLHAITEGTSSVTGTMFFASLVQHLN